jgi:hypothetical protein
MRSFAFLSLALMASISVCYPQNDGLEGPTNANDTDTESLEPATNSSVVTQEASPAASLTESASVSETSAPAAASSTASSGNSTSDGPPYTFTHKEPPPDAPPKPEIDELAQLPEGFSMPEPVESMADCPDWTRSGDIRSCHWKKYNTDEWLDQYVASLLKANGKSNTKELEFSWPYYFARDAPTDVYNRYWKCQWNGDCSVTPDLPRDDSDKTKLRYFFVLEAISHWNDYMKVHKVLLQETSNRFTMSKDPVLGLDGIVKQFSVGEEHLKGYQHWNYDPRQLMKAFQFVLSLVPDPTGVGIKAINFGLGYIPIPDPPKMSDISLKGIQLGFEKTSETYNDNLRKSFETFQVDYKYSRDLLSNGAWLPLPSRSVTDVWDHMGVCSAHVLYAKSLGLVISPYDEFPTLDNHANFQGIWVWPA